MPSNNSSSQSRSRSRSKGRPAVIRQNTKQLLLLEEKEATPPPKVDSRVAAIFDRVYAGIFQDIPKPLSKLVRVFTSSTFTDTTTERNALMEDVYPKLKEYCRETHGLDFQVVDMRWGVRDEATDDHMTTQLCINEIANCQRLSVGANFVVFLCQKYGYRPIPSQITSTEMELLKRTLKEDHEDLSILETWYMEDSNSVPAMHILQPISSILVNFNNKRMPKLQEQDTALWWEAEERMQQLLRRAARACYEKGLLDKDAMHNYFMSVTEREVIHGILKAKNPNEHCLCYVRHINNIALTQTKTASRFVDIQHNHVNTEAQKLLANLRDERVPSMLSGQNIRRSTVDWVGRDGIDVNYHAEYIRQFCADFYNSVTKMVKQAMEKHSKQRDSMFAEVLQHLHMGKTVSSMYFGREEQLAVAEKYIKSDSIYPLILQGENGCGKTSTMAKIATMVRSWLGGVEPVVILRFLGTSPDSSNISPLLTTVCRQIAWNYDDSQLNSAPTELSKLFHYFKKITSLATREKPLVLIFDSLDLLSFVDGAHELLWLPPTLPPHVKFLVSMMSGSTTIARKMQNMIERKENYLEVPSLGKTLALRVVKEWLSESGRTLSEKQWNVVGKALDKCTLPLFVKLISATVSRWRSYSRIQDTVLFPSVQDSIHALFHRTEAQHGKLLVSHALSYITAARAGISDSEVEDLISLDDKVLDDIYQYHLPPVRRIPPLLWSRIRADLPGYLNERAADGVIVLNWYHEQFRRAAIERYFKNLNHVEQCHSAMSEYFLGVWGGIPKPYHYTEMQKQRFGVTEHEGLADRKVPKQPNGFHAKDGQQRYNTRKLNELPYHLLRAGRADELLNLCLFNYDFMQAKTSCFPLQSLISDYEDAIQRLQDPNITRQLSLVVDALRLSSSLLSRDPSMLAFELLGRLLPLVNSNPHLSNLLIRCDKEAPSQNAIIPSHHSFHSPGGPLKFSLEEHMFAVFGMKLTSDKKLLISTSNKIIVWDTSTGDLARVIDPHIDGVFFGLSVSADDKWAAAHTNNNQVILASLVTGEFVSIEPESMHNQMELQKVVFTVDNKLLMWSLEQFLVYSFEGRIVQQGSREHGQRTKIVDIYYGSKRPWQFLLWSADKDDWTLVMMLDDKSGTGLEIEGSIAFLDDSHSQAYTCLPYTSILLKGQKSMDSAFSLVKLKRGEFGGYSLDYSVASDLNDRVNRILVFPREGAGAEDKWIVAICVELFILHPAEKGGRVLHLKLPTNVRNIPIKPQHSTTAVTFASHDTLFVAGVRKHLYLWDVSSQQLLRSLDAHFGRILNLASNNLHGQNTLISSSLDHTIKVWNVENIFEKSFSISTMEQSVDKIHVAREKPALAAVQTRKAVGIWDLKSHRFITSLVANVHGAVVTDSLLAKDGMSLATVESDNLLLWDLRTQSVVHSLHCTGLLQIVYLHKEQLLGVLCRQLDTPEQKTARFSVYSSHDLSLYFSFEFPVRLFRNAVVLKDTVTVVLVQLVKGHDSILTVDVVEKSHKYKFRPRVPKSQKEVMVNRLVANSNVNQIIVLESDHGGAVWDMKTRKFVRHLPEFNGEMSPDGKLGLHAPVRGGLFIIDMKSGCIIRTLIGNMNEGVNDVVANFTPNGQHVLYYHSGHKTLRVFRVLDGSLIGTFRPHATLTTWACDPSGQTLAIGGQDGSLLSVFIHDPLQKEEALKTVAQLPSRRHLAEFLHIPVVDDSAVDIFDLRNLGAVTTAVAKFKSLVGDGGGAKKSNVCSVQ